MTRTRTTRTPPAVIGWREIIHLPDLCPTGIKAKIDTGARTSALHAFALRVHDVGGRPHATFEVHPRQRSRADAVLATVPIHEFREVRSSNGKVERRPVVVTNAAVGEIVWPIEITLTARDSMGFRMLIGRHALKRRFLVDPARSYCLTDDPGRRRRTTPRDPTGGPS